MDTSDKTQRYTSLLCIPINIQTYREFGYVPVNFWLFGKKKVSLNWNIDNSFMPAANY